MTMGLMILDSKESANYSYISPRENSGVIRSSKFKWYVSNEFIDNALETIQKISTEYCRFFFNLAGLDHVNKDGNYVEAEPYLNPIDPHNDETYEGFIEAIFNARQWAKSLGAKTEKKYIYPPIPLMVSNFNPYFFTDTKENPATSKTEGMMPFVLACKLFLNRLKKAGILPLQPVVNLLAPYADIEGKDARRTLNAIALTEALSRLSSWSYQDIACVMRYSEVEKTITNIIDKITTTFTPERIQQYDSFYEQVNQNSYYAQRWHLHKIERAIADGDKLPEHIEAVYKRFQAKEYGLLPEFYQFVKLYERKEHIKNLRSRARFNIGNCRVLRVSLGSSNYFSGDVVQIPNKPYNKTFSIRIGGQIVSGMLSSNYYFRDYEITTEQIKVEKRNEGAKETYKKAYYMTSKRFGKVQIKELTLRKDNNAYYVSLALTYPLPYDNALACTIKEFFAGQVSKDSQKILSTTRTLAVDLNTAKNLAACSIQQGGKVIEQITFAYDETKSTHRYDLLEEAKKYIVEAGDLLKADRELRKQERDNNYVPRFAKNQHIPDVKEDRWIKASVKDALLHNVEPNREAIKRVVIDRLKAIKKIIDELRGKFTNSDHANKPCGDLAHFRQIDLVNNYLRLSKQYINRNKNPIPIGENNPLANYNNDLRTYCNNLKEDFLGKFVSKLVKYAKSKGCSILIFEDLSQMKTSSLNDTRLNKLLSLWSVQTIKSYIIDAALVQGLHVYFVNPFFTSQLDPRNGDWSYMPRVSYSEMWCADGTVLNNDLAASINIGNRFWSRNNTLLCLWCYKYDTMLIPDLSNNSVKAQAEATLGTKNFILKPDLTVKPVTVKMAKEYETMLGELADDDKKTRRVLLYNHNGKFLGKKEHYEIINEIGKKHLLKKQAG